MVQIQTYSSNNKRIGRRVLQILRTNFSHIHNRAMSIYPALRFYLEKYCLNKCPAIKLWFKPIHPSTGKSFSVFSSVFFYFCVIFFVLCVVSLNLVTFYEKFILHFYELSFARLGKYSEQTIGRQFLSFI